MTWKYRYRRDYFGDDELLDRLNALGDAGWSLLGPPRWVPPEPDNRYSMGMWQCFLRRVVTNREQLKQVFALPAGTASPARKEDDG